MGHPGDQARKFTGRAQVQLLQGALDLLAADVIAHSPERIRDKHVHHEAVDHHSGSGAKSTLAPRAEGQPGQDKNGHDQKDLAKGGHKPDGVAGQNRQFLPDHGPEDLPEIGHFTPGLHQKVPTPSLRRIRVSTLWKTQKPNNGAMNIKTHKTAKSRYHSPKK